MGVYTPDQVWMVVGGTPDQVWMIGGTPQVWMVGGGTPDQVWMVGGYPGIPPDQAWMIGVPPPPIRQSSIASTCYAAGGVPLAFTQEDFLVLTYFLLGETFRFNTKLHDTIVPRIYHLPTNAPVCESKRNISQT